MATILFTMTANINDPTKSGGTIPTAVIEIETIQNDKKDQSGTLMGKVYRNEASRTGNCFPVADFYIPVSPAGQVSAGVTLALAHADIDDKTGAQVKTTMQGKTVLIADTTAATQQVDLSNSS